MALAINAMDGHSLSNKACHEYLPQEAKIIYISHSFYERNYLNESLSIARYSASFILVCGIHIVKDLKE